MQEPTCTVLKVSLSGFNIHVGERVFVVGQAS